MMMEELYYMDNLIAPSGVKTFFKQHEAQKAAVDKLIAAHKEEFKIILERCMKTDE